MASSQASPIEVGDEIFGSDDDKVGRVVNVSTDYVVVEKGWFFPTDYYIPFSAVHGVEAGKVYLTVTKDEALNQGWEFEPVATATGVGLGDTWTTETVTATEATALPVEPVGSTAARTTTLSDTDSLTVPVYEEELTATKTPREVGGTRIEKSVVAEEQTLEVPVTEERLQVVRRVVDRPADATTEAFEEIVVDVPLTVEEVDVETRTRVAEEIAIQKEVVQRTEQVTGTVRREHVDVVETDAGAIVVDNDPTSR